LKKKPVIWNAAKNWKRIKSKGKTVYRHKGKFTSAKKFESAILRSRTKKITGGRKLRKITREVTSQRAGSSEKISGEFCRIATREKFYDQVIKDRQKFRNKIGEEESSGLQLWFQIGDGEKRKKKSDKRLQYTHGLRKFINLKKARRFLGFDGVLTSGDRPLPKWSKTGKNSVCKFEKKAWLVVSRTNNAGRALKPKILKKYIIQE
jgi:hypothetical protein